MKAFIVRHNKAIAGFEHKSYVGEFDRHSSSSTQCIANKILVGKLLSTDKKLSREVLKHLRSGATSKLHKLDVVDAFGDVYLQVED